MAACSPTEEMNKRKSILDKLLPYAKEFFEPLFDVEQLEPITEIHKTNEERHSTTVMFSMAVCKTLVDHLESYGPGMKSKYKRTYDASKEVKKLGSIIPGSLPAWHATKRSLPPCRELIVLTCKHNALRVRVADGERQRDNGILDSLSCSIEINLRYLQLPDEKEPAFVAVTVEKGRHLHTCPDDIVRKGPLTPLDRIFLLRCFLEKGSSERVWSECIAPMHHKHDVTKFVSSRLLAMGPSEVSNFGRRYGLGNLVRSGEEDFRAVQTLLDEIRLLDGWNVCYKFPGQDPNQIVGASPEVCSHLSTRTCFCLFKIQSNLLY